MLGSIYIKYAAEKVSVDRNSRTAWCGTCFADAMMINWLKIFSVQLNVQGTYLRDLERSRPTSYDSTYQAKSVTRYKEKAKQTRQNHHLRYKPTNFKLPFFLQEQVGNLLLGSIVSFHFSNALNTFQVISSCSPGKRNRQNTQLKS